jgi:hypothetical protein
VLACKLTLICWADRIFGTILLPLVPIPAADVPRKSNQFSLALLAARALERLAGQDGGSDAELRLSDADWIVRNTYPVRSALGIYAP